MKKAVQKSKSPATSAAAFKQAFLDNLFYTRGQGIHSASKNDLYMTLGYTVRDYLVDRWRRTSERYYSENPKFVCYLSAEYLPGPLLLQNLMYTNTMDHARHALAVLGIDLDQLIDEDVEPGLGNGGLGRLASCFLDSMATHSIPSIGYGIRYEYGIFSQTFVDGWQVENRDEWLLYGNPWEFAHPDDMVAVGFGGHTEAYTDDERRYRVRWIPEREVLGEPYHVLVPGFGSDTVNMLRLWRARASQEFDFQIFNDGDFARAVAEKIQSENLSKVLYPNDQTPEGQELRFKQQYFFVACSLHDIIRRFHIRNGEWEDFPDKIVVQLNDTHPVLAIPELMRLLVDVHLLPWDQAWDLTTRTFAYTCHTLLPESLESWPVGLFGRLLPRHLEIIYEINHRFLDDVRMRYPRDDARAARMSLIEEGHEKRVRMANLAAVGSFSVNGVAKLHSDLIKSRLLPDFYSMWPERFNNKTNGVSPRRFVKLANPALADLITSKIGDGWLVDLERLRELEPFADDAEFRGEWRKVKQQNKELLAAFVREQTGLVLDPMSLFDVMVKRLHEYKRQLLNVLHIITIYHRMKADPDGNSLPRTFLFGAKAAPGYRLAKLIIKLINSVAAVVNADKDLHGRIRVVFLENFNVNIGERVYPAAELSEQISLAGREASGTGNMKMAMNGALTIGTLDGANIEIRDRVGAENFFLFGLTVDEVFERKTQGYNPEEVYRNDGDLRKAVDSIASGHFSSNDRNVFDPIVESLLRVDHQMVLADYASYVACHETVAGVYRDRNTWDRMSILNTARCGYFSSDRTIREYCEEIWNVESVHT